MPLFVPYICGLFKSARGEKLMWMVAGDRIYFCGKKKMP